MIVEKEMRILTSHFDHVIIAIQQSNNLETLKLEDLVDSLEAHELRIVERKEAKNYWYKKDKGVAKGKDDEGENLACQDSYDFEGVVLMDAVIDEYVDSKIWFFDTGCSNHMTGQRVWLVDFDESKKCKVKLANNSLLQAEGTSNIVIQMEQKL
ncbi:uncharacterized protein LOC127079298 [Lathyrus oleraceus]|uniref:uncharacterized protein LOC127079298 n=1 Tax=Pisum sativum TaxID=3888 RepID=UPI0021D3E003|nr:uncharacterized protein LOC127079298 [Pisum sativum]